MDLFAKREKPENLFNRGFIVLPDSRPGTMQASAKMIVLDAGPLIALFDGSDRHHQQAVRFVREWSAPLITSLAA